MCASGKARFLSHSSTLTLSGGRLPTVDALQERQVLCLLERGW